MRKLYQFPFSHLEINRSQDMWEELNKAPRMGYLMSLVKTIELCH